MSDDFVKQIAAKLREDDERQALKDERAIQKANTIKTHAPKRWQEVCDWMKKFCDKENREMGKQIFTIRETPSTQLYVDAKTVHGNRLLQAEFSHDFNEITFEHSMRKFTPDEDMGSFMFTDGKTPISVEEMGQKLIKSLLAMS